MGSKSKSLSMPLQGSVAEPPYTPLRSYLGGGKSYTFQSMPGQLGLIASQIHKGYPSIDQAALLKQLQGIYQPVVTQDPEAIKKAQAAAAAAAPKPTTGGGGYTPYKPTWPLERPSDLVNFLEYSAQQQHPQEYAAIMAKRQAKK